MIKELSKLGKRRKTGKKPQIWETTMCWVFRVFLNLPCIWLRLRRRLQPASTKRHRQRKNKQFKNIQLPLPKFGEGETQQRQKFQSPLYNSANPLHWQQQSQGQFWLLVQTDIPVGHLIHSQPQQRWCPVSPWSLSSGIRRPRPTSFFPTPKGCLAIGSPNIIINKTIQSDILKDN